jgi:ribonuclease P protein component
VQRQNRLRASADFQTVRQRGRSFAGPLLALYARPNGGRPSRVGISVGKRFGPAVDRNRIKRRIREIARSRILALPTGWDLVFIPRSKAAEAPFAEIAAAVDRALHRAELATPPSREARQEPSH